MDNSKFQLELLRIYDGNENDQEFEKYRKELKELIDDPEYIPISKGTYRYKGNYIDDKFEGKGILYGINNIIIKAGFFQDGNLHGFGQLGSGKNLKYEGFLQMTHTMVNSYFIIEEKKSLKV